jgi:predicted amidohydrolase YtcJ
MANPKLEVLTPHNLQIATAVAIRGGRFLVVGTDQDVMALAGHCRCPAAFMLSC